MTSTQARELKLGDSVFIAGVTFELKRDQRGGIVVGLQERGSMDPLVTVRVPDGRNMPLDCHWIQTVDTLVDLAYRRYFGKEPLTAIEQELVKYLDKEAGL
jgi:hypothetical protein